MYLNHTVSVGDVCVCVCVCVYEESCAMKRLATASSVSALCEIACAPLVGALADSYGRKPVVLGVLALVLASNVLTAVSPSTGAILVSKAVGSAAVGLYFLATSAMLGDVSMRPRRNRFNVRHTRISPGALGRAGLSRRVDADARAPFSLARSLARERERCLVNVSMETCVVGGRRTQVYNRQPAKLAGVTGVLGALVNVGFASGVKLSGCLPRGDLRVLYSAATAASVVALATATVCVRETARANAAFDASFVCV